MMNSSPTLRNMFFAHGGSQMFGMGFKSTLPLVDI
jgi:hypothetical protein